jgi:hypothetical protein
MLHAYRNGNCMVKLHEDGTKERCFSDRNTPNPAFPESVDLKITEFCDMGCPFCHEDATMQGSHADIDSIKEAIEGLPRGVELAIGGGDPLTHPNLKRMLIYFRNRDLIANITVNEKHLERPNYFNIVQALVDHRLIYGVGISLAPDWRGPRINLDCEHQVAHVIAGVHSFETIQKIRQHYKKVLILGYKDYGRGREYHSPKVAESLDWTKYNLWRLFYKKYGSGIVSFDNLAIGQLEVWKHFTPEKWKQFYMGDDGQFTCYYNAVTGIAKVSSTSNCGIMNVSIIKAFSEHLRNLT